MKKESNEITSDKAQLINIQGWTGLTKKVKAKEYTVVLISIKFNVSDCSKLFLLFFRLVTSVKHSSSYRGQKLHRSDLKGNKKYFESGRFESSRVRVTQGKSTVNV